MFKPVFLHRAEAETDNKRKKNGRGQTERQTKGN